MDKTILQYQRAFNSITERLKSNSEVIAVMVFGSMVSGDLWDESDIDLFVIENNKEKYIRNIYTEEKGVAVHIKAMSKKKFLDLHEQDLKGGFIHRIFASSRLVFSKDFEVTTRYDNGRYYPDLDRERWNIVYLGNVLKNISTCKKYLCSDVIYTSYSSLIRCTEEFAKLIINSNGYMISKDAMTMAMNLSDSFKEQVDKLFFKSENIKVVMEETIAYFQDYINNHIKQLSSILIDFMRQKDSFLSSEEINNDKLFYDFEISMEEILNYLWEKNIIKRDNREYKTEDGETLFKENVYFI